MRQWNGRKDQAVSIDGFFERSRMTPPTRLRDCRMGHVAEVVTFICCRRSQRPDGFYARCWLAFSQPFVVSVSFSTRFEYFDCNDRLEHRERERVELLPTDKISDRYLDSLVSYFLYRIIAIAQSGKIVWPLAGPSALLCIEPAADSRWHCSSTRPTPQQEKTKEIRPKNKIETFLRWNTLDWLSIYAYLSRPLKSM